MPPSLLERTAALLDVGLTQGYGMTELSGNAVFLDEAHHRRGLRDEPDLLRAAGRPGLGVSLRIVDAAGTSVAPGVVGEILVAGPQVMEGYLDDDEATAATLADGWLHTGDLGRLRPDGLLEIVDRLKDLIITGGENVASVEVEEAIRSTCPEITSVAVVGVPDARWGQNVCCCCTVRDGTTIDVDEVARRLHGHLAGYKIPRHLVIVDELPMTHSGKVAKAALRESLSRFPERLGPRRGSQPDR